jgi:hypothetical protein
VSCGERALEVLPHIKKYAENKPKLPNTVTSTTVKAMCDDKLAAAKLAFFVSVAAQFEPFLRKYQTATPMAPFLYEDIADLLRGLMKRFVKKSIMDDADSSAKLIKIDLSKKETRGTSKEVDVGVGATAALAALKLSDSEKMGFRMQCIDFLCAAAEKIVARSPLKQQVVRSISCLVPSLILSSRTLAKSRMKVMAQILYETGNITALIADNCKSQFSNLCIKACSTWKSKFSEFSRTISRLDTFYNDIIGHDSDYADLFAVVKLVLILSHGNATVEGGFSINGDMLVENLHEESLVAQRTVYDAVQSAGGLSSVQIDKTLLSFVRGSHARYLQALERKRQSAVEHDKQVAIKRKADSEIKQLEIKKNKVLQSAAIEAKTIETEIAELKRKST